MFSSGPRLCNSLQMFQACGEGGAFPTTVWMEKKKAHFAFCPGQTQREGSAASVRVHSACHTWPPVGLAEGGLLADLQRQMHKRWTRPHRTGLSVLNTLELSRETRTSWQMCLVRERRCSCVAQTLTNHKSCKKFGVRVVDKVSREACDCSVCSAWALTLI